jgi:hypothetical protein
MLRQAGQVSSHRLRTGIQPLPGQRLAEPDDPVFQLQADRPRAGMRAARSSLEPPRPWPRTDGPASVHRPEIARSRGATSQLERPSNLTAVITSRASDMAHLRAKEGANYVPRHLLTMSCNQSPKAAPKPYSLAGGLYHADSRRTLRPGYASSRAVWVSVEISDKSDRAAP